MKPIEYLPPRRRPVVKREERRTVMRAPLNFSSGFRVPGSWFRPRLRWVLTRNQKPGTRNISWLESRLVYALAVGATLLCMGIFVGFLVGFLIEASR